jgi:hypothetical protein
MYKPGPGWYTLGPGWPPAYVEIQGERYPWREYNQPDRGEWTGSYDLTAGYGVRLTRKTESGCWARIYTDGDGQVWNWSVIRGEDGHRCDTARTLAEAIAAADRAIAELTASVAVAA